jgi:hypothetical protein
MTKEIKRKEFFIVAGKGAIAAAVLSFLPVKIFSFVSKRFYRNKQETNKNSIKITINPSAVKRNKG